MRPAGDLARRTADRQLRRAIGPWALGANAVNLAVGGGIFAMPAIVAALLGSAAILAYVVCGVAIGCVLLCFAELGSQITRSGGAIAYIEEAFGPLMGWLAWAVFAVGFSVFSDAAIANVLVDALAGAIPLLSGGVPRAAALAMLFSTLALVNILGLRQGLWLSLAVTVGKLAPLVLLIALGWSAIDRQLLQATAWPEFRTVGEASLVLFFAFGGLESALTPSGEIRDPARTVPRGLLGGAGALFLLYSAIQVVSQGVLGAELGHTTTPLAAVAERLVGPTGQTLVLVAMALSTFGALSADTIGTPRAFLAAAERGLLPRPLAAVHPTRRTPHVAIAAFAAATALVAISGGFRPLAIISSLALLVVYFFVCLGTLRVRSARGRPAGTFRTPGGPLVPVAGAAVVVWLMAQSTRGEWMAVAGLVAVALVIHAARRGAAGWGRVPV